MTSHTHGLFTIFNGRLVAGSPDASHATWGPSHLVLHDLDSSLSWEQVTHLEFTGKTAPRMVSGTVELGSVVLAAVGLEWGSPSTVTEIEVRTTIETRFYDIRVEGRARLTRNEVRTANTFASWLIEDPTRALVLEKPHEVIRRFRLSTDRPV